MKRVKKGEEFMIKCATRQTLYCYLRGVVVQRVKRGGGREGE